MLNAIILNGLSYSHVLWKRKQKISIIWNVLHFMHKVVKYKVGPCISDVIAKCMHNIIASIETLHTCKSHT